MSKLLMLLPAALRVYIGWVFVTASLYKIYMPYDFAVSVATYQIAPLWTINLFSIVLPWIELVVGAAMIAGLWRRASSLLTIGMMLMFLTVLVIALFNGLQMSCGCFAAQDTFDEIGIQTVFRDLSWLACAIATLLFDDGRYALDGWIERRKEKNAV